MWSGGSKQLTHTSYALAGMARKLDSATTADRVPLWGLSGLAVSGESGILLSGLGPPEIAPRDRKQKPPVYSGLSLETPTS